MRIFVLGDISDMSETAALSCGVPQGSVLGPLFLAFHHFKASPIAVS